jgi:hypothetical protein
MERELQKAPFVSMKMKWGKKFYSLFETGSSVKKLRRIEKEEKRQMRFIIKYSSFGENVQSSRCFSPSHSLHGYSLDGCWQNKFLFALLCMHKTYDI